jgi:hypothetical protein
MPPAPGSTFVMTAPPYECPVSTTGPSTLRTRSLSAAESAAMPRNGFAQAMTRCPATVSGATIPFQLDEAAQAP